MAKNVFKHLVICTIRLKARISGFQPEDVGSIPT